MLNEKRGQELVRDDQINPLLMRTFSIIIPAYNEERRIGPVSEEVSCFIAFNKLPWEVILAVDGKNETEKIVMKYREQYSFIYLSKSPGRTCMDEAIRRGIMASNGEIILLIYSEGSASIVDAIRKAELVGTFDIMSFNRYSSPENEILLKRRFASGTFNSILRALFSVHIFDTQCGYKI